MAALRKKLYDAQRHFMASKEGKGYWDPNTAVAIKLMQSSAALFLKEKTQYGPYLEEYMNEKHCMK